MYFTKEILLNKARILIVWILQEVVSSLITAYNWFEANGPTHHLPQQIRKPKRILINICKKVSSTVDWEITSTNKKLLQYESDICIIKLIKH